MGSALGPVDDNVFPTGDLFTAERRERMDKLINDEEDKRQVNTAADNILRSVSCVDVIDGNRWLSDTAINNSMT